MDASYATNTRHKYILSSPLVGGIVTTPSPVNSLIIARLFMWSGVLALR
ncbi:hypothetical protein MUK42_35740 [Musa troglodytarum]|uniref:Uncharacterized protein n=1 Tax=Musa troglodytarum TaxID=320322 RepID=A0A9E7KBU1_9LILI|nr:hypothetical protein MUK42_35740 [Musa troglodytarum]